MTITYNGATAGSTSANPPVVIAEAISGQVWNSPSGGTGAKLWFYNSTNIPSDLAGTSAAPTFTDGAALGMRAGDVLIGVGGSTTPGNWITFLGVVAGANASSGAWLSTAIATSTMA